MSDERRAQAEAIAEAVIAVLAERGLLVRASPSAAGRVLTVREVAALLGRSKPWVYQHATELGAIRMGSGPKARIAFDVRTIEDWKQAHRITQPEPRKQRRRPARGATSSGVNLIPYEPARYRA